MRDPIFQLLHQFTPMEHVRVYLADGRPRILNLGNGLRSADCFTYANPTVRPVWMPTLTELRGDMPLSRSMFVNALRDEADYCMHIGFSGDGYVRIPLHWGRIPDAGTLGVFVCLDHLEGEQTIWSTAGPTRSGLRVLEGELMLTFFDVIRDFAWRKTPLQANVPYAIIQTWKRGTFCMEIHNLAEGTFEADAHLYHENVLRRTNLEREYHVYLGGLRTTDGVFQGFSGVLGDFFMLDACLGAKTTDLTGCEEPCTDLLASA